MPLALAAVAALAVPGLAVAANTASKDKIPITTSSEEARQLYVKGRDLAEKLRATDGRALYEQAVAKDKTFALAHLGLANTAGTAKEFFDSLGQAVVLSAKTSEPERLLIAGVDAGAKGDVTRQREAFTKLVAAFPNDERAHNLLGGYYFGRQEYAAAVAEYEKAIAINPSFSQPYNQMGYAYRFLYKYPEAEKAFKKYIELIPGDPNPFDSYAELLMKTGRFEESIKNYEKALAIDKNFVASWVGIGNNRMFMGQGDKAREAFAHVTAIARNDGEKRLALFWSAMSYVHEGATDKAIAEIEKEAVIAKASGDKASLSGDWNQIGDICSRRAARTRPWLATRNRWRPWTPPTFPRRSRRPPHRPASVRRGARRPSRNEGHRPAPRPRPRRTPPRSRPTRVPLRDLGSQHELADASPSRRQSLRRGRPPSGAGQPAGSRA
jgi:tetratricopeptide (TPR) repeat protein